MADHTVELETKLNTQQAEQKLNNLASKAGKKLESPAGAAFKGIDVLSDSLKKLRNVIGGGVLVQSLGQLAKSMDLFGDKTDKIVNQFTGAFNRMMGAIASGNPVVVAMTGAMEALMYALSAAKEERDKAIAGLNEQNSRAMKWLDFRAGVADYRRGQQIQGAISSGDTAEMRSWLEVMKTRRADVEQSINAGLQKGYTKDRVGDLDKLVSEAQKYDSVIKQLEDALKRQGEATQKVVNDAVTQVSDVLKAAAEARQKRQEELSTAKESWQYGEDFAEAKRTKDVAWLQDAMDKAKEGMRTAKTAAEFREASSRYGAARSALQDIDEDDRKTEIERLRGLLDSMKASPVSNYTAAGFSMGEQLGTEENISRNVEQIVRQLQQMLNKQLQVFNLGQGTI